MKPVFEALVAALIVGLLVALAWIPPLTLMWLGVAVGTLGALIGIPAGFVYHAKLWAALQDAGIPTKGMLVKPYALHDKLDEEPRERVRALFAVGAAGFLATVVGAAGVTTAIV
ncbi:hypothetical protein PPSIR1_16145, partial [Plesiocystis pacifica SIR-1]